MQKESQRHNDKGWAKTSLKNILLTLFVLFAYERELETEQKLQHIDLTSPSGHSCVPFSFTWCSTRGPGAHSAACWLSLPQLVSDFSGPQLNQVPQRVLSPGGGFLYHKFSPNTLIPNSLTSCLHRVIS